MTGAPPFVATLRRLSLSGVGFATVREGDGPPDGRPLLVVVHPGDLVEPPPDGAAGSRAAYLYGRENQAGAAEDLARARTLGWDVAALHRESCAQYRPGATWTSKRLGAALREAWRTGWVAYGDDLDDAAAWLRDVVGAARRPRVVMTGARSSPGTGRVTALAATLGTGRVAVSRHSPGGDHEGAPVWRPGLDGPIPHRDARDLPDPFG